MTVHLEMPDDVYASAAEQWGDVTRKALEAFALEGYKSGALGGGQVRRMLGLESQADVHLLLKQAGIPWNYGVEEFEQDMVTLERLGFTKAR